jgi:CheY-like chemotaxis protein
MQILVIDDDIDDYEFFVSALKHFRPDARSLHVENGVLALEVLKELSNLPNYIFLNINMPRMNGTEVLIALKTDSKLKDIPVIMWSTSTCESEQATFKKLGAIYFLSKPTEHSQLVNSLKVVIK